MPNVKNNKDLLDHYQSSLSILYNQNNKSQNLSLQDHFTNVNCHFQISTKNFIF